MPDYLISIIGALFGFLLFWFYQGIKERKVKNTLLGYAKSELNSLCLDSKLLDNFLTASSAPTPMGKGRVFSHTHLPHILRLLEQQVLNPVRDKELIDKLIQLKKLLTNEKDLSLYASIEAVMQIQGHETSEYKNHVTDYKKQIREVCREIQTILSKKN